MSTEADKQLIERLYKAKDALNEVLRECGRARIHVSIGSSMCTGVNAEPYRNFYIAETPYRKVPVE